jgi:phage FluMu protein Com
VDKKDRFFNERNGADALSCFLIGVALFLVILFLVARWNYLTLVALIPIGFAIFRILSKDLEKRGKENAAFVGFFRSLSGRYRLTRDRVRDRKTHVYFRCGCCERWIRVERGQGEVKVTCPGCHTVSQLDTGSKKTEETEEEPSGAGRA